MNKQSLQLFASTSVLILSLVFSAAVTASGGAALILFPTEAIISGKDKSQRVSLINKGDATGIFEISWFDSKMTPEGTLQRLDESPTWSLQPHVRFSPRRVVLKPGQSQIVKIVLRHNQNVTEGEYFSHLQVLTLNDNVDSSPKKETTNSAVIKAKIAIAVPVIWRNSRLQPSASLEDIQYEKNSNRISLNVVRSGYLSTRGFVKIFLEPKKSPAHSIAEPVHTVIYPNIDHKKVSIPLTGFLEKAEPGTHVIIRYVDESNKNKRLLGEERLTVESLQL